MAGKELSDSKIKTQEGLLKLIQSTIFSFGKAMIYAPKNTLSPQEKKNLNKVREIIVDNSEVIAKSAIEGFDGNELNKLFRENKKVIGKSAIEGFDGNELNKLFREKSEFAIAKEEFNKGGKLVSEGLGVIGRAISIASRPVWREFMRDKGIIKTLEKGFEDLGVTWALKKTKEGVMVSPRITAKLFACLAVGAATALSASGTGLVGAAAAIAAKDENRTLGKAALAGWAAGTTLGGVGGLAFGPAGAAVGAAGLGALGAGAGATIGAGVKIAKNSKAIGEQTNSATSAGWKKIQEILQAENIGAVKDATLKQTDHSLSGTLKRAEKISANNVLSKSIKKARRNKNVGGSSMSM